MRCRPGRSRGGRRLSLTAFKLPSKQWTHRIPSSFALSSLPCRHVMLPKELAKPLNKARLLSEAEWRGIGVQQSRGWEHYAWHKYVGGRRPPYPTNCVIPFMVMKFERAAAPCRARAPSFFRSSTFLCAPLFTPTCLAFLSSNLVVSIFMRHDDLLLTCCPLRPSVFAAGLSPTFCCSAARWVRTPSPARLTQ